MHTLNEAAKDCFDAIEASDKKYVGFDRLAYWLHITEYSKYRQELKKVISKTRGAFRK